MSKEVSISHIDTCLGCYLTDHHNRPGEHLVGVYVDGTTTFRQVKTDLLSELNAYGPEDETVTDEAIATAVGVAFSPVPDLDAPFDASLETPSDEERETMGGDECQAWFLLEWETDKGDEG